MSAVPTRTGLLFAAAGTTCPEAGAAFDCISRAALARFPQVGQKWTYTSSGVRRKLVSQGCIVLDPQQALTAMEEEGFTHVAVLSLHLSDGMEFGELAETVAAFEARKGRLGHLAIGRPLLTSEKNTARALEAVLAGLPAMPAADDAVVLVAHGSKEPDAVRTLQAAVSLSRRIDRRLIMGMMLGSPSIGEVLQECRDAGVKKAWLVPLMIAAGYSVRDEIAGAGAGSWTSRFEEAGIRNVPVLKGLGEYAGVVEVWMDQADELLKALRT
jgi:sirohydrochlorin cobaltochelatase